MAAATAVALPYQRPWREPRLSLSAAESELDLPNLIDSPRFVAASLRHGIDNPRSLVLLLEKDGGDSLGVEASFYAKSEKRRLIDLSTVLRERQQAIAEAEQASTRPSSAAVATSSASLSTTNRSQMAEEHAQQMVSAEKKRAKAELMKLVHSEAQEEVHREEMRVRLRAEAAAEVKNRIEADLKRRNMNKERREQYDAWQDKSVGAMVRGLDARREKMKQDQANRDASIAARAQETKQEARRRDRDRVQSLELHRSRSAAQRDYHHQLVAERRAQRDAHFAAFRAEREKARVKVVRVLDSAAGERIASLRDRIDQRHETFRKTMEEKAERVRASIALCHPHMMVRCDLYCVAEPMGLGRLMCCALRMRHESRPQPSCGICG